MSYASPSDSFNSVIIISTLLDFINSLKSYMVLKHSINSNFDEFLNRVLNPIWIIGLGSKTIMFIFFN